MGFLNDSDEETEEEQTILTYALSGEYLNSQTPKRPTFYVRHSSEWDSHVEPQREVIQFYAYIECNKVHS